MNGASYLQLNSQLTPEQQLALEDQALVSALQAGEESAYETLLTRFQTPVYNLAWRLLNDSADAGDVVQEVFFKVFRSVHSFRGDSTLRTWIYRIAVNESHNRRRWLFRHRRGESGLMEEDEDGAFTRPIADSGESPFDFTVNRQAQLLLEEGLGAVSPAYRAALLLREVEDLSYEEIAAVLEVSIGTVKSRIVRGRESLKRYLTERLEPAAPVLARTGEGGLLGMQMQVNGHG